MLPAMARLSPGWVGASFVRLVAIAHKQCAALKLGEIRRREPGKSTTLPRVKRRLLNALAILSAALCLATLGLSATSYWGTYNVGVQRRDWAAGKKVLLDRLACVQFAGGSCAIICGSHKTYLLFDRVMSATDRQAAISEIGWSRTTTQTLIDLLDCGVLQDDGSDTPRHLGFSYHKEFRTGRSDASMYRVAVIPAWLPIVSLLVLPIARISAWNRQRMQLARGCCTRCGYDLRATPDRCPECGQASAKAQATDAAKPAG